jgi:pilus assembly protein FimV
MTKAIQRAAFVAALLAAGGAQALTIGNIEVKSLFGERFQASIPVTLAAGEDITPGCVRLEDSPSSKNKNVPALLRYNMQIERNGRDAVIRISTTEGLSEPAVRVGLLVRCGAKLSTTREFLVMQPLADTGKK